MGLAGPVRPPPATCARPHWHTGLHMRLDRGDDALRRRAELLAHSVRRRLPRPQTARACTVSDLAAPRRGSMERLGILAELGHRNPRDHTRLRVRNHLSDLRAIHVKPGMHRCPTFLLETCGGINPHNFYIRRLPPA